MQIVPEEILVLDLNFWAARSQCNQARIGHVGEAERTWMRDDPIHKVEGVVVRYAVGKAMLQRLVEREAERCSQGGLRAALSQIEWRQTEIRHARHQDV